jgi:two-component system, LytTR family, response regulator
MHRLVTQHLELPKTGQSAQSAGPDQSRTAASLLHDWSDSLSAAEGTSANLLEVPDRIRGAAMDTIDTIIVDDEPLARQKLAFLLKKDPAFRIVAQCSTAGDAIQALSTHHPALLFLDIQMPDDNGFAVVNAIDPDHRPKIIFTTAYDQYAMQAFEAQAIDYLLKPFDEERFARAVKRAKDEIAAEAARRSPANGHKKLERFIVKSEGRILFFTSEEIDWIEAASNYVRLFSNGKGYLVRHTMNELERKLDAAHFLRIHRSIIVNIHKIRGIQPCNSGEFIVSLVSGKELPSSRGYRQNLGSLLKSAI